MATATTKKKRQTRSGFGRIEQLSSGRWRAAYVGPDGVLYRASETFESKADGSAWLSRRRAEIAMAIWAPETVVRSKAVQTDFRTYAEKFLRERTLKPRTRVHYQNLLDVHILPTFGNKRLGLISSESVMSWYETVAFKKPTTRSHAYGLLRTILGSAVQAQKIPFNPCHIRGAGRTKPVHKVKPATLPELEVIVSKMPDRYKTMTLLAAWCAMRFGELTELRRKDIDLTNGVVMIRRGVVHINGEAVIGDPKSEAGIRDVAIPPHLLPIVKRHLKSHVEPGKDALLFPAAGDPTKHLKCSTLYKCFYPAREAAGRDDLRWHDLRHTGAVLAAHTGATLSELMGRLGHSTPQAALRYQHVANGRDAEIARRLSELAGTA